MNEMLEIKIKNVLFKGMLRIEDAVMKKDPFTETISKHEMVDFIFEEIKKSNLEIK